MSPDFFYGIVTYTIRFHAIAYAVLGVVIIVASYFVCRRIKRVEKRVAMIETKQEEIYKKGFNDGVESITSNLSRDALIELHKQLDDHLYKKSS